MSRISPAFVWLQNCQFAIFPILVRMFVREVHLHFSSSCVKGFCRGIVVCFGVRCPRTRLA